MTNKTEIMIVTCKVRSYGGANQWLSTTSDYRYNKHIFNETSTFISYISFVHSNIKTVVAYCKTSLFSKISEISKSLKNMFDVFQSSTEGCGPFHTKKI